MRSNTRDLCTSYSAECLKAAEDTRSRTRKEILFEMAMAWLKLADHADEIRHILTAPVADRSRH